MKRSSKTQKQAGCTGRRLSHFSVSSVQFSSAPVTLTPAESNLQRFPAHAPHIRGVKGPRTRRAGDAQPIESNWQRLCSLFVFSLLVDRYLLSSSFRSQKFHISNNRSKGQELMATYI
jgi:hypothetical protein